MENVCHSFLLLTNIIKLWSSLICWLSRDCKISLKSCMVTFSLWVLHNNKWKPITYLPGILTLLPKWGCLSFHRLLSKYYMILLPFLSVSSHLHQNCNTIEDIQRRLTWRNNFLHQTSSNKFYYNLSSAATLPIKGLS